MFDLECVSSGLLTLGFKFVKPHIMTIILFSKSTWEIVITEYILIFYNLPITLSTCMHTCAICLHISTSLAVTCFFPLIKVVILNTAPTVASSPSTKNSQSASIQALRKYVKELTI